MSIENISAADNVMVSLERIPTDDDAQTRVTMRAGVVRQYAAAMTEQLAEGGLRFPPVILFSDGAEYWLGDGCHRVLAARKAGLTEIAADVRPGTKRDAQLFAISANGAHGLPRTNADKRKAVTILLADSEWSQWSDREIARRCQVHHKTVNQMRRSASGELRQMRARKVQRCGAIYEMSVHPRETAGGAAAKASPPAVTSTDRLGIPLPEPRAQVFSAPDVIQEAHKLFDQLTTILDRIAQGPAGELYRREMVRTGDGSFACPALRICRNKLLAAEPYCSYCPNCHPTHPTRAYPACKSCAGLGWTTRTAFDSCRAGDKEQILKLRVPSQGV